VRVVHVFKDYYPPTPGGIEQHVQLLCTRLAREMDVAVLVPSRSWRRVDDRLNGVRVVRVPELGRYASVPLCPTMPRELGKLAPDVVHLHFPNPMGDLAYLFAARPVPLVVTYHADVVRHRLLLPLYRPLLARMLAAASRIICTSPDYVASSPLLSGYRGKCTIVPFGIDPEVFALQDGEEAQVGRRREAYGEEIILFLGVLRHYKGVDVLLRALTHVRAHAVIVGRGPLAKEWRSLARQLGVADRATFLGEISDAERRILLHACEILVLPSIDRREAFGIAQLEAMACGKPVVSSDLPTGVRLVNRDGETGLLVPPGNPEALAAAITRLLSDSTLRTRLGQRARERVIREFSVDRMVNQTIEVYSQLVPSLHD
jgi:glycosyltransferase involved in cell wall biosynthesis